MNNTEKMLDELLVMGHLVGIGPEDAAKMIPHQTKMKLLRFWNDYKERNDLNKLDRFLEHWRFVRNYIERHI